MLHVPHAVGKVVTQGALPVALLVALTVNRRVIVRPNVFLCLVSLLVIEAVVTTLQPQHFGTVYRFFRLVEFVAVLWLLTPWWGRRDLLLVRAYLVSLSVALGTVILGLLVVPGHALSGGRLNGVLCDIPATEVGHYAAVTAGLMVVLWLGGMTSGRVAAACGRSRSGPHPPLPHEDRPGRHGGKPPGRGPEPDRNQGAGPQVLRSRRRRCVDRSHDGGRRGDDLAGTRGERSPS